MDDGPYWVILLLYESHDMRHTGFHKLMVVNGTLGFWGVTFSLNRLLMANIVSNLTDTRYIDDISTDISDILNLVCKCICVSVQ